MRTIAILAAGLLLGAAFPAQAQKLPTSDPLAQLLLRADADRDWIVTGPEADAAVLWMYENNVKEARTNWLRTLRFMGLPPETEAFPPSRHVATVIDMLEVADSKGDRDGAVTRDEIGAYALAIQDQETRDDILDLFDVADGNRDNVVSKEERDALVAAAAAREDKPLAIATILEAIRADAENDARLVAELFAKHAVDGKLKVQDVVE